MGRQYAYPNVYPSDASMNGAQAAWVFLCSNYGRAPELVIAWFENECDRLERWTMAKRGNKNGDKQPTYKADWKGFANIDLSAEDKAAIKGGIFDGEAVLDILSEIVGTGHKITVSYDRDKDTVSASVTGIYSHCKNAGLTFTSFARTLPDVLTVVAYKHEVVAKGNWSPFISRGREVDDIG